MILILTDREEPTRMKLYMQDGVGASTEQHLWMQGPLCAHRGYEQIILNSKEKR